jgi:plastocyanin
MSRVPAACAALLSFLLLAGPASAATPEPGTWDGVKGVQHLHFETGPILVKPGQNSINNVFVPPAQKPKVDGYIVRARPDLTYLDGEVPPVDVIHLHHGVWLNTSGQSPASPLGQIQPIFFGGEEKTIFRIPKGYGYDYKKSDKWILNEMIHNNTPNATKVRLVWDLDFIPKTAPIARSVTPVIPFWMDVRRGWGYPVFDVAQRTGGADGQFTFPDESAADPYAGGPRQNEFSMPYDATLVAAVGHLHPGGLRDDVDVTRAGAPASKLIFRSEAKYYDPAGPVSWDVSLTASKPKWRVSVKAGDVLGIHTTYDARQSSWYENMGIVLLFVAPHETSGPDPFATAVDPNGELTHGHLAENDHHGGKAVVYPDARKAKATVTTTQVKIKDYQFRPGDLGLLLNKKAKLPVVPQGQSLSFVNQDDPSVEWHSITTCRSPCNRQTGISYPLANGLAGTQFDSGQLGFGPAGASPAANRVTWQTPSDLPEGTYTYFCRIHPFMRGAFRVQ